MEVLGRALMLLGAIAFLMGLLLWWAPSIPWLGRLPGDVRVERPGFRFYFPVTTSILLSVLLSVLLWLVSRLR